MTDALTYNQRLKLGAIRVRRDFADEARKRAVTAALLNDYRACEMLHAEADRHEAAIIEAAREMDMPDLTRARMPLRAVRAATGDPRLAAIARPIEDWNRFMAKLS